MALLADLLNLFYPKLCQCCDQVLEADEQYICLECRLGLPKTNFHLQRGNPAERIFWGRIPVENASAYLNFQKSARVQQLLHHIKYKGYKETAMLIGEWHGADLATEILYGPIQKIIPVPLHKDKLKTRGYNQSEWYALGLSKAMAIPLEVDNLVRTKNNETQTRKKRYKRWENVSDIFNVVRPGELEGAHILLVDDVVTTGATLEACAQTLLALNCGIKISIATLAFAS